MVLPPLVENADDYFIEDVKRVRAPEDDAQVGVAGRFCSDSAGDLELRSKFGPAPLSLDLGEDDRRTPRADAGCGPSCGDEKA